MSHAQPDNNEPFKLFKQNTSSRWSMRFSIKGQGQQRITLGVENYAEAKLLAWDKWHEVAALAKLGLSVTRKRFEAIAEEFIEEIEFAVERGEKEPYHARQFPPIVRRYFVGFFGNKLLTGIKSEDIEDYWRWRIDYWVTGAGANEPLIRAAGFDMLWFGVYLMIVVEMAQITPPIGFNLFVLQGMTGKDMAFISKASFPMFVVMGVFIVFLVLFPGLATWLPEVLSK